MIITLAWKKLTDIWLKEAEKELLKQLSNDGYQPGWHKIIIAPITPGQEGSNGQPPPYEYPEQK